MSWEQWIYLLFTIIHIYIMITTEQINLFLMLDPLRYFMFKPVLHNWCNKGGGMYYPFC